MSNEKYFFEMPVYRCAFDDWVDEINSSKRLFVKDYLNKLKNQIPGKSENFYNEEAESQYNFSRKNCSTYRCGELVGLIRLFAYPDQIRGELYFVENRISKRLKHKKWSRVSHKLFDEISISNGSENKILFQEILNSLNKENGRSYLKRRYIDLECFKNLGPNIDFLGLAKG